MSAARMLLVVGLAGTLAAWLAASGCADDGAETTGPVVLVDAGPDAEPDAGGGGQAPHRTVETRNPFGDVGKVNNLLWDGDLEWGYPWADQYGWFVSTPQGYLTYGIPTPVIGARCRSGIKCAELEPDGFVVAVGVASQGHSLEASLWARPGAGGCGTVQAVLASEWLADGQVSLGAESSNPDGQGWCFYRASVAERHAAVWLYIENQGTEPTIIDDAVVEPVEPRSVPRQATPWPAARQAHFDRVREQVRELLRPRDPPPNPDRLRFERQIHHLHVIRLPQH
jgi:hypothetical protein